MAAEQVGVGTASELTIAAVVNVLVYRGIARAAGAPGWIGGLVAASSMAIAADPAAPARARQVAGTLSAPGAVVVQLIRSRQLQALVPACCPNCANGTTCEAPNGP